MKFALTILALYIGFLSCFPCQDVPERAEHEVSSYTDISHKDAHHNGEAGDFCSPFCICYCCASVNMPPLVVGVELPLPLPSSGEKSFEYKVSLDQNNAGLIWQPPRQS